MKILFTGGGTGGHFYPLIAIAEKINKLLETEKIVDAKLYFMSTDPYDKAALFEQKIEFRQVSAGKLRIYASIQNIFDIFKTFVGVIEATMKLFFLYPDVVISKGGYAAFPVLFAARLLRIPVIVHESDSYPGRVNKWSGKFAERVAISFESAAEHFPKKEKVAYTGQPIREDLMRPEKEGFVQYFNLDPNIPTILVLGGSQGAEIINNLIVESLPDLLSKYQVIHQTGVRNLEAVKMQSSVVLKDIPFKERYHPYPFLNALGMKMAAGAAKVIVSRAGSSIFEIAEWQVPSVIIPITNSNGDHQRKNAYSYARSGACVVIEESNLSTAILCDQIDAIALNNEKYEAMKKKAADFSRPDAALVIAKEVLRVALSHEK